MIGRSTCTTIASCSVWSEVRYILKEFKAGTISDYGLLCGRAREEKDEILWIPFSWKLLNICILIEFYTAYSHEGLDIVHSHRSLYTSAFPPRPKVLSRKLLFFHATIIKHTYLNIRSNYHDRYTTVCDKTDKYLSRKFIHFLSLKNCAGITDRFVLSARINAQNVFCKVYRKVPKKSSF